MSGNEMVDTESASRKMRPYGGWILFWDWEIPILPFWPYTALDPSEPRSVLPYCSAALIA